MTEAVTPVLKIEEKETGTPINPISIKETQVERDAATAKGAKVMPVLKNYMWLNLVF